MVLKQWLFSNFAFVFYVESTQFTFMGMILDHKYLFCGHCFPSDVFAVTVFYQTYLMNQYILDLDTSVFSSFFKIFFSFVKCMLFNVTGVHFFKFLCPFINLLNEAEDDDFLSTATDPSHLNNILTRFFFDYRRYELTFVLISIFKLAGYLHISIMYFWFSLYVLCVCVCKEIYGGSAPIWV